VSGGVPSGTRPGRVSAGWCRLGGGTRPVGVARRRARDGRLVPPSRCGGRARVPRPAPPVPVCPLAPHARNALNLWGAHGNIQQTRPIRSLSLSVVSTTRSVRNQDHTPPDHHMVFRGTRDCGQNISISFNILISQYHTPFLRAAGWYQRQQPVRREEPSLESRR